MGIQTLRDVPTGVRTILEKVWPGNFQSYTIVPGNDTEKVRCIVWDLTDLQRKLVRNWEIIGEDQDPPENRWYEEKKVTVVLLNGSEIEAVTEGLREGQSFDRIVDGERYMTFLNDPALFKKIATEAREDYLRQLAESQGLPTS
ncbi:MAG: hypothetical protein A2Y57_03235 [Candidatus Woykebacteria bacterium RBG_13_40_7b]|uniref:Uncharacterized protein n=1 Tax=Candidatus Woykebacteria bacterium RBG_13_40_7b TaxID=1802594 RepID=A0A1G1W636_9BACT|nr:MAG: hypothetical protein A2Y57_03235 [Candidatus Woykebacteria bacterium RBG_13_40_7b]